MLARGPGVAIQARAGVGQSLGIAALPAADRLQFASNLNSLLSGVSLLSKNSQLDLQNQHLDSSIEPQQLVSFIAQKMSEPNANSFQIAAAKAILGAAINPEEFLPLITALKQINSDQHPSLGVQAAENLTRFINGYQSNESSRATLERTAAGVKLNIPESLNVVFDGIQILKATDLAVSGAAELGSPVSAGPSVSIHGSQLLPSPHKPLPLARLVSFLVASKEHDREALAEAIRNGHDLDGVLARAPGRVDYWQHLIEDFSHSQFADRARPMVELITNSIDAVQGDFQKDVEVTVDPESANVALDRGKGMSLPEVLEKLLVPMLSGKEGQNLTGRFGVGFYSTLQYLAKEEHSMQVETSDGQETIRVNLRLISGQPYVSFDKLPAGSPRGTRISIRHSLKTKEVESMVYDTLKHNTKAKLFFNGKRVNTDVGDPNDAAKADLKQIKGKDVAFLYKESGDGRVYVTLNGVTIFSREIAGQSVLGTLVVDFPVQTQLAISRNMLMVDQFTREMAKQTIDLAAAQEDPYQFLNSLVPIIEAIQSQNSSPRIEDNVEIYLRAAVAKLVGKEQRPLVPDTEEMRGLNLTSPAYLEPSLFNSLKDYKWPFEAYTDFKPSRFDTRYKMYLAPFKDDGKVLIAYGDSLFLNARYQPQTFAGKAILQALLEVKGLAGSIDTKGHGNLYAILTAPFRWILDVFVTVLPGQILDFVYNVRDAFGGRSGANASNRKNFTEKESNEFGKTMKPTERIVDTLLWFYLYFHAIGTMGFIHQAVLSLILPAAFAGLAISIISMVFFSMFIKYKEKIYQRPLNYLFSKLRPYNPRYSFLILPIPLLTFSGISTLLLKLLPQALAITPYLTGVVPLLLIWIPVGLFLISIRKALADLARLGLSTGYAAIRSAPLAWRWRKLPQEVKSTLRSILTYNPATWVLAAILALSATSSQGKALLAQPEAAGKLKAAIERAASSQYSFSHLAHGSWIILKNPETTLQILEDYDPTYFNVYVDLAGLVVKKFPSTVIKPDIGRKFREIWTEDMLRKDRESLERISKSINNFSGTTDQQIPRTLRPYLMHLMGKSFVNQQKFTAETNLPALEGPGVIQFDLSTLFGHYLDGQALLQNPAEILTAVNQEAPALRTKVAKRALANSVNFQSVNPYIFIREIIQNTIDESTVRQAPEKDRALNIRTSLQDDDLAVTLEDHLGMDFVTLANYLLLPNTSTKRDNRHLIGHSGHGFLTILKDAKEVVIKTSKGDGKTYYVRLAPQKEKETVVEVKASLAVADEIYTGTRVVWTKETPVPDLEAAHIKSNTVTFAGLVDSRELRIYWDQAQLNKSKELLAKASTPEGDLSLYKLLEENTVIQRGLYVRELDEDYLKFIPVLARDILLKKGIVVQIPQGLKLTRDRSDIVQKNDHMPAIGNALGQASLRALVNMYVQGDVSVDKLFPKDFITNARQYVDSVPDFVLEDVARLRNGDAIQDPSRYTDPTNLAMLLASVPAIKLKWSSRVRGKVSLLWVLRALDEGRIHWLELPSSFSELVVGKSLKTLVFKYAKWGGAAVVVGLILWKFAVPAWNGAVDGAAVSTMSQTTIGQIASKYLNFSNVTANPELASALQSSFGTYAGNPFMMAGIMLLNFILGLKALLFGAPLLTAYLGYRVVKRLLFRDSGRLPPRVDKNRDLYWGFSDWTSKVESEVVADRNGRKSVESIYFNDFRKPVAQAEQGRSAIFWNLKNYYFKRNPYRAFQAFLQGSRNRGTFKGMASLFKVVTHEAVHIGEQEGEWTEDARQEDKQAVLLGRALAKESAIEHISGEVRDAYHGRFGSPIAITGSMSRYPETSLEKELWPGESAEPFPLRSAEDILKEYESHGVTILGEVRRNRDGGYNATGDNPLTREMREAAESVKKTGIDPAMRRIVVVGGASADVRYQGFEWTHDGALLIHESAVETLLGRQSPALTHADVLTQIVLRYALGPGRPAYTRLTPKQMMDAGIWPGGVLKQREALEAARKATGVIQRRNRSVKISWGLLAGVIAYGTMLIYAVKDSINGGLIQLIKTPNLLTATLFILPIAWPVMKWILGKINRSFEVLKHNDLAPGMEKVSPIMRSMMGKAAGTATASEGSAPKRASLRSMAVFSVLAFMEEYFFRYILFHGLGSWLAASLGVSAFVALPLAAVLSALLFALYHFTNWKNLTAKEAVGLTVYYGTAALFLTAIYWVGGIWIATFVHMYYNTHQDELKETSKKNDGTTNAQDRVAEPAPSQEVQLPLPKLEGEVATLSPLAQRKIIIGSSIQNRIAPLLEEVSPTLAEAERRAILKTLASGAFLGTGSVSVGFETSDAAMNLKRELEKHRNLSVKRFNQALNNFIEELPPQMLKTAVGYLLTRLEGSISTHLRNTQKAKLPVELEAYRETVEEQIATSLGAPISVHVFQAENIMSANPGWGWPLIRVGADGKIEVWLAERIFYAMRQQEPNQWGGRLSQLTLAALKAPGHTTVGAVDPKQFNELGVLIAESADEMEAHKPWFQKLRTYFIWTALTIWTSFQALPMIKLLLVSPTAFPAALTAKWGIFAANFAVPGLLIGFLGALAIDWGTKILINRWIPQVDHRESFKLQWKTIKLGVGSFSIPFPVTNVLHWTHGPRRVFTLILPIAVLLAGVNLTANPIFAGILLGGAIGNTVEVLLRKGATDWIPMPFSIANAADFAIAVGILGPWILAAWHLPLALAAGFALRFAIGKTINLLRPKDQKPMGGSPQGSNDANDQTNQTTVEKKESSTAGEVSPAAPAVPKTQTDLLSEGERVYASEPNHYAVEDKTLEDLEVFNQDHGLYKIVNKTHTAFGAKRLEWLMRHPFMDTAEIHRRQEAVQEILRDKALRDKVEAAFKKLGSNGNQYLWHHFFGTNNDQVAHITSKAWATSTSKRN